ncbi:sodium:solute symporter [Christiangramia forsetii]|uniref:Sodium:solute symporter family protein n=2 Tax=Christiangramia forsetii TaxID=411153 RepID=A0M3M2_CHRFK|nr:sodium:solute symporter [Christiangramia forsetii]GGG25480.1 sodium:solute symporter [Christiangramia forsetii]CAL67217.1 sodium:solute symporter family protein [Christiangramia forsetii KT0803]
MQPYQVLILIAAYFAVLILISYFTGRGGSNAEFFKANKQAPWYLVAFGMIGASLSGITFISIPGTVESDSFSYFQVVLGYTVGYAVIGQVLLPLYYKMNLTSIYTYLESRFGNASYKTGASFFLLSRVVGASFRLFLVANVLQLIVFDAMGVPYYVTVTITILLIWLYTFKSGIKTIIWTDTLQTFFMLLALGITIYFISEDLGFNLTNLFGYLAESEHSQIFFFDDWKSKDHFVKQFLSGAFIAIVMTGLDQDMMQKNLTCRSLKDAQKNVFWFTIVLVFVNFLFLALGVLLTDYADINGITEVRDDLFPAIATSGALGMGVAIFFILGLIAAAYSSADSALTSLTTSFSIDILDIEKKYDERKQVRIRKQIHIAISVLLILVMLVFKYAIADKSVINKLFQFAGYTYGPLLGLYAFGLFTKWNVKDKLVPIIAIAAPILSYIISINSLVWFGFEFGFFILILNGFLTFLGLVLLRRKHH